MQFKAFRYLFNISRMALSFACSITAISGRCIASKIGYKSCSTGFFLRSYGAKKSVDKYENLPKPPPRPWTPYIQFAKDSFAEVKQNNQDMNIQEISRILGQKWSTLDKITKENYEKAYKERKEAYDQELKKFKESLTEEEQNGLKEKKKILGQIKLDKRLRVEKLKRNREFHMPKNPASAYSYFIKAEYTTRDKDISVPAMMKQMSDKWSSMTDSQKKVYYDEVARQKEFYEEQISEWVQRMVEEGNGLYVDKKILKKELDKLGKPMTAIKSPYRLYLKLNNVGIKDSKWKELAPEEKQPYIKKAEAEEKRYEKERDDWYENLDILGKSEFVKEAELLLNTDEKKMRKVKTMKKSPKTKAGKASKAKAGKASRIKAKKPAKSKDEKTDKSNTEKPAKGKTEKPAKDDADKPVKEKPAAKAKTEKPAPKDKTEKPPKSK